MMKRSLLLAAIALLLVSLSCGVGTELTEATATPTHTSAPPAPSPIPSPTNKPPPTVRPTVTASNTIAWDQAKFYIGEFRTVCGPVVDTHYASSSNGQPTFLNLGREYPDPDRFTLVIWGRNRNRFPSSPEQFYRGKTICVNGLIEEYSGVPEIEVSEPTQIETR
jgi:hypothetical protein